MKNIVILNGSIRKKSTFNLLNKIAQHLDEYSIDFINISDYTIKPCIGCEQCILKGKCSIKDDAEIILNKLIAADGIILGTPVYLRQISGYLKTLIDRGCSWYHRSPLVGKPIFFVSTTQASGTKQTIATLKDLSIQWGTIDTGSISRMMYNLQKPVKEKQLQKFKYFMDEQNRINHRPSFKQIKDFYTQKVLAKYILPMDFEHWTEKGYINKHYYYDCRINIFKRFLGYLYFKILSYFISKNKS